MVRTQTAQKKTRRGPLKLPARLAASLAAPLPNGRQQVKPNTAPAGVKHGEKSRPNVVVASTSVAVRRVVRAVEDGMPHVLEAERCG